MNSSQSRSRTGLLLGGCLTGAMCLALALIAGVAGWVLTEYEGMPGVLPTLAPTSRAEAPATMVPENSVAVQATATALAPPNPLVGGPPTAMAPRSTPEAKPALALNPPEAIVQQPPPPESHEQLEALLKADYPVHDFFESVNRLGAEDAGPRTVTAESYQIGDRQTFYVDETETTAVLAVVTDHIYFWVEDGLSLDQETLSEAAQTFEEIYYPRLVSLFGQEWQPGVDNDPHFSVLHLNEMRSDTDELGYFNSGDEYPRTFYSSSNQQEIIYLNMANLNLASDLYFGTLVHEFQHLVQWYVDPNEMTWLDEGLSQLAEIYVGLETADARDYLLAPNTQLTAWDYAAEDVYAQYGATFLFSVYLWEQLGDAAIQELARHPANGIAAVEAVLQGFRPDTTPDRFFAEWMAANYLDDESAGPQYHYRALDLQRPVTAAGASYAPFETIQEVDPFGIQYVDVPLQGSTTLSFAGDTVASLLGTSPHSGQTMWFAPALDSTNAHLTRRFDLAGLTQATLTFWTWYDLQFDLDYAYISISQDEGATWQVLGPGNGRPAEFGPALNGRSKSLRSANKEGWVQESVSLDAYTGGPLLVRFEMLTYYGSQARGFAVDDIAIPELGYATDLESGTDGWQAAGFVPTGTLLPQRWAITLIHRGNPPRVTSLALDEFNQGQWTVELGPEGAVVAIMPLTPFVEGPSSYWLYVEQ